MDRKRIVLISAFVLSVIIFGWLLYAFFFKSLIGPGPTGTTNGNGNLSLPQPGNGNLSTVGNGNQNVNLPGFGTTLDLQAPTDIARGGFTKVVDYGTKEVQGFVAGATGAQFYDRSTSQFFKVDGSTVVPLSDKQFFNVDSVTWSQGLDKAVLEYPDGSNVVYDFTKNKQITLPKELTDFSFDVSGSSLAAKWYGKTNDENWLMITGADGSNITPIEPLGDRGNNVEVAYSPNSQIVALVRKPSDANYQEILPIGIHGENLQSFKVEGLKFESKWAPRNNTLLYNVSTADNEYNPKLFITGGANESLGSSHVDLKLNTTVDKCTFDATGTSVYCAEPTSLPRGSGLYPELARGIPDAFYRIDLRTGQKIPLALPVGDQSAYSATSVFLSGDQSQLFFVDTITQRLHSIRLQ